jgi:CDP-glucose 4,6-dehydratase
MENWKSSMENMVIDSEFWRGKKVFITGNTGFKGSWLSLWLLNLGAKVTGYSLEPPTNPSNFEIVNAIKGLQNNIINNICDLGSLTNAVKQAQPDIVIHMAAQSLVRQSYEDPVGTYMANVMGTVHILESVRKCPSVKAVLNITTDKCYENNDWLWGYRENEPMGGHDPYSNSKGCAELVSSAYRKSFFNESNVALATARAGNVIGGGDFAKDRLVPDAVRAFINNETLVVRNPSSIRPWQHVLEPLSGYIMLCQKLIEHPSDFSEGWNFGSRDEDAQPVSKLADIMVACWGEGQRWELDDELHHPHEARYLKLDCSKANSLLNWFSQWELERALDETIKWYKAWHRNDNMHEFTIRQIETYQKELNSL